MKICSHCKIEKPLECFYMARDKSSGYQARCIKCGKEYKKLYLSDPIKRARQTSLAKASRLRDPEKFKRSWRDYAVRSQYGITLEQYEALLELQGGVCYICKKPETKTYKSGRQSGSLAVDHCHQSNRVRALLCYACNQAIGLFKEDPEVMDAAARYIRGDRPTIPPSDKPLVRNWTKEKSRYLHE